jgi:hypothetical protein
MAENKPIGWRTVSTITSQGDLFPYILVVTSGAIVTITGISDMEKCLVFVVPLWCQSVANKRWILSSYTSNGCQSGCCPDEIKMDHGTQYKRRSGIIVKLHWAMAIVWSTQFYDHLVNVCTIWGKKTTMAKVRHMKTMNAAQLLVSTRTYHGSFCLSNQAHHLLGVYCATHTHAHTGNFEWIV